MDPTDYKASTTKDVQEENKKLRLRFSSHVKVKKIRTHRNYTDHERQSVWYTSEDYRTFKMNETNDKLSTCISPSELKFDKIQRAKRIDELRYMIVRAQDVHRKVVHNDLTTTTTTSANNNISNRYTMPEYFTKWLADLCHQHSQQCVKEGRQRGIENDMDTIKLRRETSSTYMLLKRSTLFKKLIVSSSSSINRHDRTTNTDKKNGNDRWTFTSTERSSRRDSLGKRTRSRRSFNAQISTNPVKKRSKRSQQILNNDLDLDNHNTTTITAIASPISMKNAQSRWSATAVKNSNSKTATSTKKNNVNSSTSNSKDAPLKPLRHTLTPPFLIDTNV
jgi:hypothetical protein